MKDDHLFGQGGEELTGKIPVQYFIQGADPTGRGAAEAEHYLQSFLMSLRASTLQQAQFRARLAVGGEVTISHIFGVTQVEIVMDPPGSSEPVFYGGILIKPTYIVNESTFFNASVTATNPTTVPVEEVASAGTDDGEGGRPAVPGTLPADVTDWLVVQIAKDKPLGPTPIASGTVKIFRIKDPKFGPYVEVRDDQAYLLSAIPAQPTDPDGLSEFYLCGKKVTAIPPLVVPDGTLVGVGQLVRLRTYALTFESFETADQAQGIIIFANGTYLYAYDTSNAEAGWVLLHSVPAQTMNDYGAEFEETEDGGVTTITCSGFNGAGACSGFEVVITPVPNDLPTITGTIFPMGDGSVAAGSPTLTFTKSITNEQTLTTTPGLVAMSSFYDFGLPGVVKTYWSGTNSIKGGPVTIHVEGYYKEGTPALSPDKFAGGFAPTYQEVEFTFTYDWVGDTIQYANGFTFDWVPIYTGIFVGMWLEKPWSVIQDVVTESATVQYVGNYLGDQNRFTTRETTYFNGGWEQYSPPDDTFTTSGSSYTFSGALTFDPVAKLRYIGSDQHVDRLRFQREEIRTGAIAPSWPVEDTTRGGLGFNGEQATPTGDWDPFAELFVSIGFTSTPPQMPIRLLRRGEPTVFEWSDILALGTPYSWQTTSGQVSTGVDQVKGLVKLSPAGFGISLDGAGLYSGAAIGLPDVDNPLPAIPDVDHFGGPGASPKLVSFASYPAPGSVGGYNTWTLVNPDDPTNVYDINGNNMGSASEPSFSVTPPWSMTLTYPGNYPEGIVNYSDLVAILVMSRYATTPFDYLAGGVDYVMPATFQFVLPPFTPVIERGVLQSLTDLFTTNEGLIFYDMRTTGFIAQIRSRRKNGVFGTLNWHFHDAVIGNAFETMPLADVLAEWRALGEDSGNSDGKHIFLQTSPTPSLL